MQKDMMYNDIDESRRLKLMKDEQERLKEIEAEERAKQNHTYFRGYDQRQKQLQDRM